MILGRDISARSEDLFWGVRMSQMAIALTDEMRKRLEALAQQMDQSVAECVQQAIVEFVDNWEDHLRVVAALQEDEVRPDLRPVAADHG